MNVKITHLSRIFKPRGERPLALAVSYQRSVGVGIEVEMWIEETVA